MPVKLLNPGDGYETIICSNFGLVSKSLDRILEYRKLDIIIT